ncbi:MAG: nuclear transport factor 2 family protein [Flavobacteriaceae bacterium]
MKQQQRSMIKAYINAYNNMDVDGMTEDLAEDVVFENISSNKVDLRTEGLQAFKKQAESALQYFTKRKQSIKDWEFSDSKVTIVIDYEAILAIDLPNGLKKGDTLKLEGASEFEFEKGKIKSIRDKS